MAVGERGIIRLLGQGGKGWGGWNRFVVVTGKLIDVRLLT